MSLLTQAVVNVAALVVIVAGVVYLGSHIDCSSAISTLKGYIH